MNRRPILHAARLPLAALVALTAAVLLLLWTSPRHEEFWWTDAASFALNGEFVRDYLATGLGRSPMAFANAWFLRYPALTISLYPPIFPLTEAGVFAVFGFSQLAAQATVAAFTALAAWAGYRMARSAMPTLAAAGFVLVMLGAPGVMLWSRQVMMEIPSLSFLLIGAAALLRYQAAGGGWRLFLAVAMVLAGTYTKQTAIFAGPAFAVALLAGAGPALLRRPSVWLAAITGVILLLPLAAFTLKFAPQLVDIAAAQGSAGNVSRWSAGTLTAYARALPSIAGWVPVIGSLGYLALVAARGWASVAERRLAVLMLCWFVTDYLFVTLVGHFEERYGLMLAIPTAAFSVLLVLRLVQQRRLVQQGWAAVGAFAAGIAVFIVSLAAFPIPWVGGYGAVAAAILRHTAQNEVVLFEGDDSKSLMFSLRARSPTPKVYVLRAEKLLVNYNTIREWGIQDRNVSPEQIEAMIDRFGVALVALQPGFWTDQPSMARLEAIVTSDRFEQVDELQVPAEAPGKRATIKLFRNRHPHAPTPQTIQQMEARP